MDDFGEWRRIVTVLLPTPSEAVAMVRVDVPARPASAGRLPPSRGDVTVSVLQNDPFPVDMVHRMHDGRSLYSRCRTDGQWTFGQLAATSVSDTALPEISQTQPSTDV